MSATIHRQCVRRRTSTYVFPFVCMAFFNCLLVTKAGLANRAVESEKRSVVAVLELQGSDIPPRSLRLWTDLLRTRVIQLGGNQLDVMTGGNQEYLLKANGIDPASVCDGTTCDVEILRNLAADYGFAGSVTKLANKTYLGTLELYDTTSGTALGAAELKAKSEEELIEVLKQQGGLLCRKLPGLAEARSVQSERAAATAGPVAVRLGSGPAELPPAGEESNGNDTEPRPPIIAMLDLQARNVSSSLLQIANNAVRDELTKTLATYAQVLTPEEQTTREKQYGVDGSQRCNSISCEMEKMHKIRADFGFAGEVRKTADGTYVVTLRVYDLQGAKVLDMGEVTVTEVVTIRNKVRVATETLCKTLPVLHEFPSRPAVGSEFETEASQNRDQTADTVIVDEHLVRAKIVDLESKAQRYGEYADTADTGTLRWALGGVSVPLGAYAVCCAFSNLGFVFGSDAPAELVVPCMSGNIGLEYIIGALGLTVFESIVLVSVVEEQQVSQTYRRKSARAQKEANKLRTKLKEAMTTESFAY